MGCGGWSVFYKACHSGKFSIRAAKENLSRIQWAFQKEQMTSFSYCGAIHWIPDKFASEFSGMRASFIFALRANPETADHCHPYICARLFAATHC